MFDSDKVFVIAEAGVNHDGDLSKALQLVDVAADSGADAVKFQTFLPGECTGRHAFKTDYMKAGCPEDESRYELSCRLALPFESFVTLKQRCEEKGLLFLSTPDGNKSLNFLVDKLHVPAIKIASTEVTNIPFLQSIASQKLPIIFSTGLSTLGEVEAGLSAMRGMTKAPIVVLHCTTEYPAPFDEINLRAMQTMARAFQVPVGFSDHSIGSAAAIAAVALGAKVIEKHFTLSRAGGGPDHQASMEPDELKTYISSIRCTELLLGNGIKQPTAAEERNRQSVRRSVVAAHTIPKGHSLTREMLTCKRPGTGISPAHIDTLVGFTLNRELQPDEVLTWEDIRK
ncbi:N-acetylneuraminate synthase [Desulfovibrio ferrophilus]|uniref:N-acylneuraminate-9-phosphate synthase n=1 Tax=Desulfovibrio ferrophilus TaxID=241368 RepID=A0A2Z6B1D2_9BACT|nr:N-acetylneuraminate synthase [Desulfovibrio ferrophilus]BBD09329.1 N-acylneuraminate-9-phosphate synthase [Desulfovibrio ferrophilus]